MNYTNLSQLPTKKHRGDTCVDWKNTPGHEVEFSYNGISGTLLITDFNPSNGELTFEYESKVFTVKYYCMLYCKLGVLDCIYFNHPMSRYIKDTSISLKYKPQSNTKTIFKCDICGDETIKVINTVYKHGYKCRICSSGISFPEKFTMSVLDQLGVEYIRQYKIIHNNKKYYFDFFIPSERLLIEVDGGFHYRTTKISNHVLVNERDEIKNSFAFENGYNLCRIDARKSNKTYLSSSIQVLSNYISLDNVDFQKSSLFAMNNLIKDVCDYKNSNPTQYPSDIAKKFNISSATVRRYLVLGNESGYISYNIKKDSTKRYNNLKKPVEVIQDGKVIKCYKSISDCINHSKIDFHIKFTSSGISSVLTGRIKTHKGYSFKYKK